MLLPFVQIFNRFRIPTQRHHTLPASLRGANANPDVRMRRFDADITDKQVRDLTVRGLNNEVEDLPPSTRSCVRVGDGTSQN